MADSLVARNLLDEDSALLIDCSAQSWIGARRLTRAWTKVRDREMEECAEFLGEYASEANVSPTLLVTNPKASHETYDGIWAHQSTALRKGEVTTTEGVTGVVQVLQEVFPVADFSALSALLRRRERTDSREAIFDFQDGQGEQVLLVFPFLKPDAATEAVCMDTITELNLLTLAPANHMFDTRKWDIDQETHTATLTLVFRKIVWNAWGHDAYAEDYYEYTNVGVNNTEEIKTRTWVHIQNADVATAVDDLRAKNRTPSTHALLSIDVANAGNGGCTITVREQLINIGETLYGQEILRPHGWDQCVGTKDFAKLTLSRYETSATLAARVATLDPVGTPPSGYTFVKSDNVKDGNGFYGAYYLYEKITWIGAPEDLPDNPGTYLYSDEIVTDTNEEGNGHAQGWQICSLDKDNVRWVYDAIAAPTDFVISRKNISVNQDGEFSLSGTNTSVSSVTTVGDALVVLVRQASGSAASARTLQRVWFRRTEAAAAILTTPTTGAATLGDTIAGTVYAHISVSVTDHHDGAHTVTQTMQYGSHVAFRNRHDMVGEFLHLRDYVLKRVSAGAEEYEWYIRHVLSKLFTAPLDGNDAWNWATTEPTDYAGVMKPTFDDTTGEALPLPTHPTGANTQIFAPTVKYVGGGTWQAFIEFYTEVTWKVSDLP